MLANLQIIIIHALTHSLPIPIRLVQPPPPPNMYSTLVVLLLFLTFTDNLLARARAQPLPGGSHALPGTSACRGTCGSILVKYPFGTGFGCGHPDFAHYIKCDAGALQFSTNSGVYTISSVDYTGNTVVVTDPLMSTCTSMQNSGGFGLDSTAPFSLVTDDIFVLLGCSTTSPVYDLNVDMCDSEASHVCKGMYSCKGVTGIGLDPNAPISTCCVYDPPMGVGSGYQLDLPKLQCSSYTCIHGYGGNEGDPAGWEYGISLQFNGTYSTNACDECEASAGTCGFSGTDEKFVCVCRNGVNTTTNCYGQGYSWNNSSRRQRGVEKFSILGFFLFWLGLFRGRRL